MRLVTKPLFSLWLFLMICVLYNIAMYKMVSRYFAGFLLEFLSVHISCFMRVDLLQHFRTGNFGSLSYVNMSSWSIHKAVKATILMTHRIVWGYSEECSIDLRLQQFANTRWHGKMWRIMIIILVIVTAAATVNRKNRSSSSGGGGSGSGWDGGGGGSGRSSSSKYHGFFFLVTLIQHFWFSGTEMGKIFIWWS